MKNPTRLLFIVALLALAMLTVGPASVSSAQASHARSDKFWAMTFVNAMEVERYDSLAQLATSADVVVAGKIESVRAGRTLHGGKGEAIAWLANVTVVITKAYSTESQSSVTFEVTFVSKKRFDAFLAAPLPDENAYFFLRDKGVDVARYGADQTEVAAESGHYRLVNMYQGVLRILDHKVHVMDEAEVGWTQMVDGLGESEFASQLASALR